MSVMLYDIQFVPRMWFLIKKNIVFKTNEFNLWSIEKTFFNTTIDLHLQYHIV